MATRAAVLNGPDEQGRVHILWEGLLQGDDGSPVEVSQFLDKTCHSDGSYSGAGAITMQGSNNGSAWYTLADATGMAVLLTSDAVGFHIAQSPRYLRPLVADGDGSTDIDVLLETYIARG
jgi:hypothetical protein